MAAQRSYARSQVTQDSQKPTAPLVSVIIPTYNGSGWITETLNSAVRQSYPSVEIIVVDDGSEDSTPGVLRAFGDRIQVHRTARAGIGRARNAGLDVARGEYLAFLDHDDLWAQDKVSRQVEYLQQHPEIDVLFTDADEFDHAGTHAKSFFGKFPDLVSEADIARAMVLKRAVPLMSTVMVRASFLREHAIYFHPNASGVDDVWFLLQTYLNGGVFARLDERLTRRRLHDSNLSGNHYNRFSGRITVYQDLMRTFPAASSRTRRLLAAGLRDANFRVGEWHWGQLDPQKARTFLRAGMRFSAAGIKCSVLWALTFAPRPLISNLRSLKQKLRPMGPRNCRCVAELSGLVGPEQKPSRPEGESPRTANCRLIARRF